MGEQTDRTPDTGRPAEAQLESWKEIAAYLQRDVSTAMRWEKSEGLPVRRHRHRLRSSVYAYPSELDAWRAERAPESGVRREPVRWPRPMAAFAGTCVVALLVLMGGAGPNGGSAMAAGITTRQVWANRSMSPLAVSYDGRFLAYNDWETGHIAVYDLRSGERRNMTTYGSYDEWSGEADFAAWSRDGSQLAYEWYGYSSGMDLRVLGLVYVPGFHQLIHPLGVVAGEHGDEDIIQGGCADVLADKSTLAVVDIDHAPGG